MVFVLHSKEEDEAEAEVVAQDEDKADQQLLVHQLSPVNVTSRGLAHILPLHHPTTGRNEV